MLSARPLYDSEPDRGLFVEPLGWQRLVAAVEHRFNVALLAPRGGGKTTALRQLQLRLRESDTRVAYVDATAAAGVGELFFAVERELAGTRGALREFRDDVASVAGALTGGPPGSTSLRLVQRVRALADLPETVVLVDCAHAAPAAHALFGRLRDELWQLDHRWVVAVEDAERAVLLAPPADAFFEQVVSLQLAPPALAELLRTRGADLPEDILRQIAETAGTPRAALQAARDALTSPDPEDPLAAALWRQEVAARLGRPHSMALAEIEALGGASASDEEFLRRLGWTRSRAAQVLGELAQSGVVVAADENSAGGARPRRVYRPAAPPAGSAPRMRTTELDVPEA